MNVVEPALTNEDIGAVRRPTGMPVIYCRDWLRGLPVTHRQKVLEAVRRRPTSSVLSDPIEDDSSPADAFAAARHKADQVVQATVAAEQARLRADGHEQLAALRRGTCHLYWGHLKRLLKEEHGIDWLSPADMQPSARFDGWRPTVIGPDLRSFVPMPTATAASTRLLTDAALLAQCRLDQFRGPGPGGQKRNKTSSAVRLVHVPTGTAVTATEDRSLRVNKVHALRRLKLRLAVAVREPVDLRQFEPPEWFLSVRRRDGIEASHRHPLYAAVGGLLLDLLHALGGNPAAVAVNLGVSTTAVLKRLEAEPAFWTAANDIRARSGFPPLTHRR